jgi:hypothetical protein
MAQTSAKKKQEIEHGTTTSSGTIDTSSSTISTISPSQSKPGLFLYRMSSMGHIYAIVIFRIQVV